MKEGPGRTEEKGGSREKRGARRKQDGQGQGRSLEPCPCRVPRDSRGCAPPDLRPGLRELVGGLEGTFPPLFTLFQGSRTLLQAFIP